MTAAQVQEHGAMLASSSAFRDIAVIVTGSASDRALALAAANLARISAARLHILRPLLLPMPAIHPWALMTDPTCAARCARLREAAAVHNATIEAAIVDERVEASAAVLETMYESPGRLLAGACQAMDIAVLMRPDNMPVAEAAVRGYFADLLLGSGRPVIVLPPAAAADCLLPGRVVVAWSGSAECARAVHEAMPLLHCARVVEILSAVPAVPAHMPFVIPAETLASHLAHHDIDATVVHETIHDRPPAHHILAHAASTRATMIVAGGYGHSRLKEWIMGGTTRSLFHDAPVPVLFSH
ncbi:Universal stress protein family protein [Luteibacter sp. UNCMF331Sha3.1]|uniref:universal stress protein n=1 Tax=Luteibacter sp. UNCMF331Sha3.1 TaxID=1502760 RepID=UPI0008D73622|nr:universal stress protein [Luteibacter sp. UNCMF331Sha3.1]SEN19107.1 Universal stress protein family protein [Luteibacter sp. UNCMF331Sha3.1]